MWEDLFLKLMEWVQKYFSFVFSKRLKNETRESSWKMKFKYSRWHSPKEGYTEHEYEDAFYPEEAFLISPSPFTIAVADGATESAFSKEWAQILCESFGKAPFFDIEELQVRLPSLMEEWNQSYLSKNLPWYSQRKIQQGSFSTFLGIHFTYAENLSDHSERNLGYWRAIAIGDTCLFHIRNEDLVLRFPLTKSSDFSISPYLLSSLPEGNDSLDQHLHYHEGSRQKGDIFILATDALAQWFLREWESKKKPWKDFYRFQDQPNEFQQWLHGLRKTKKIHNDDSTLIFCEVSG